ncbi:MAG: hypothetical protein FWD23_18775 [Oscillospiraceae bacterium]|nr:hypothetical protein [Oscillospiraceae bacterium]
MLLTLKEMELLCVFHDGTLSKTLGLLREAENEPPERMAMIESLIEKLSGMEDGEPASLAFEPEV